MRAAAPLEFPQALTTFSSQRHAAGFTLVRTISLVRDLIGLTQVFNRKCDFGHCSIRVELNNVREAAFDATKEEKAGHQGKHRTDQADGNR